MLIVCSFQGFLTLFLVDIRAVIFIWIFHGGFFTKTASARESKRYLIAYVNFALCSWHFKHDLIWVLTFWGSLFLLFFHLKADPFFCLGEPTIKKTSFVLIRKFDFFGRRKVLFAWAIFVSHRLLYLMFILIDFLYNTTYLPFPTWTLVLKYPNISKR